MTVSTIADIRTRPATEGDRAFIERVFVSGAREMITEARGAWDEERERASFREELDLASTFIVRSAQDDVGFLTCLTSERLNRLYTICILPEYQGRGVGTRVIQSLIESTQREGRELELRVLKTNSRARALYERLGFRVFADTEYHHRMSMAESRA